VVRAELRPKLDRVGFLDALRAAKLQQRDLIIAVIASRCSGGGRSNHEK
jgi:hypothetical protein